MRFPPTEFIPDQSVPDNGFNPKSKGPEANSVRRISIMGIVRLAAARTAADDHPVASISLAFRLASRSALQVTSRDARRIFADSFHRIGCPEAIRPMRPQPYCGPKRLVRLRHVPSAPSPRLETLARDISLRSASDTSGPNRTASSDCGLSRPGRAATGNSFAIATDAPSRDGASESAAHTGSGNLLPNPLPASLSGSLDPVRGLRPLELSFIMGRY
jgi:hypothetical protein